MRSAALPSRSTALAVLALAAASIVSFTAATLLSGVIKQLHVAILATVPVALVAAFRLYRGSRGAEAFGMAAVGVSFVTTFFALLSGFYLLPPLIGVTTVVVGCLLTVHVVKVDEAWHARHLPSAASVLVPESPHVEVPPPVSLAHR